MGSIRSRIFPVWDTAAQVTQLRCIEEMQEIAESDGVQPERC